MVPGCSRGGEGGGEHSTPSEMYLMSEAVLSQLEPGWRLPLKKFFHESGMNRRTGLSSAGPLGPGPGLGLAPAGPKGGCRGSGGGGSGAAEPGLAPRGSADLPGRPPCELRDMAGAQPGPGRSPAPLGSPDGRELPRGPKRGRRRRRTSRAESAHWPGSSRPTPAAAPRPSPGEAGASGRLAGSGGTAPAGSGGSLPEVAVRRRWGCQRGTGRGRGSQEGWAP